MNLSKTPFLIALMLSIACYVLPMAILIIMPLGGIFYIVAKIAIIVITYPITLLVTFVHEGGHALMALATGGSVTGMSVSFDGSGLTSILTYGGLSEVLVANAGYLSATLYGATLLILVNRGANPRLLLRISMIFVGCSMLLFTVFAKGRFLSEALSITIGMSLFTLCIGSVLVSLLWLLSNVRSETLSKIAVNFIAIECLLNAVSDIRVLLLPQYAGTTSDATHLADITHIPAVVWILSWGIFSLFVIWKSYRLSLRDAN